MLFNFYFIIFFKILPSRLQKKQNLKITDFFPRGPNKNGKCSGDFKYCLIAFKIEHKVEKSMVLNFYFIVFQNVDF